MTSKGRGLRRNVLDTLRSCFKIPVFENILASQTRGSQFGTFLSKLPANHYSYPDPSWREVQRYGLQLRLDISKLVDWFVYFNFLEPEHEELVGLVKPGDTIIDVGANIGLLSMRMAKQAQPNGRILAFEPFPNTFNRLQNHISINQLQNLITPVPLALGSKPGQSLIEEVDARNPGMNRISAGVSSFSGLMVTIDTLDNQLAKTGIEKLNGIKIDVEGFEYEVLMGAARSIETHKPFLFIEVDDDNLRTQGSSAAQLVGLLEGWGYAVRQAGTSQIVRANADFAHCHYDIICKSL
jgi:FkbM family methyltransferase